MLRIVRLSLKIAQWPQVRELYDVSLCLENLQISCGSLACEHDIIVRTSYCCITLCVRPKVTLHFSVQNTSTLILILSKLNIAMSFQHMPFLQNLRETEILNMLHERPSFFHQKYCQTFCHKRLVRFWQCVKVGSRRDCLPLN